MPGNLGELLDVVLSSAVILVGICLLLIASSFLAGAAWAAIHFRLSSAWAAMGRWAIGGIGTVLLTIGLIFVASGTETALGRPLGDYSGSASVWAWWFTFRVIAWDAAIAGGSAHRIARDQDDGFAAAFSYWAYAVGVGALVFSYAAAFAICMIALAYFFT